MIKVIIGNQSLIINKTDGVEQIGKAIKELGNATAVLIEDIKTTLSGSFPHFELKASDDFTSFVPRFGVFNESLALPLEKLFANPKPFKGYFKPIFYRKCFMQLKTFQNLRFRHG